VASQTVDITEHIRQHNLSGHRLFLDRQLWSRWFDKVSILLMRILKKNDQIG